MKIEEMEKMLKEAQLEKARLIESRVRFQKIIQNPYCVIYESSCGVPVNSFELIMNLNNKATQGFMFETSPSLCVLMKKLKYQ